MTKHTTNPAQSNNGNKTKPGEVSVEDFLASLDERRREESRELITIMRQVSGKPPVMWGRDIVGFGAYHYKYESGREGDWLEIGFSPRKAKLSIYITCNAEKYRSTLADMGKHSVGKGCIYINKLDDVDTVLLHNVIQLAYEDGRNQTQNTEK